MGFSITKTLFLLVFFCVIGHDIVRRANTDENLCKICSFGWGFLKFFFYFFIIFVFLSVYLQTNHQDGKQD